MKVLQFKKITLAVEGLVREQLGGSIALNLEETIMYTRVFLEFLGHQNVKVDDVMKIDLNKYRA